jgi:hypothetical protein
MNAFTNPIDANFDAYDFNCAVEEHLGLRHLRIGDWGCLSHFAEFDRLWDVDPQFAWSLKALELPCVDQFGHNLAGNNVWVNHSFQNSIPASSKVKGFTIADVLLAIDEALGNHLIGDELHGGRSCYIEDIIPFPCSNRFGNEYLDTGNGREEDVFIILGS